MKNILVLDGSTRKMGNTSFLLEKFLEGARGHTEHIEVVQAKDAHVGYCNGCLRCNLIKKCAIRGDQWDDISQKILGADVLVIASPIYFHYVTAPIKKIIDRFRSFVHVEITEESIKHTPHVHWKKDFVLLLSMGSSDSSDAMPVIDLFNYMKKVMGHENNLHVIQGTRLALIKQVQKSAEELRVLYPKLNLDEKLADGDYLKNKELLTKCFELGRKLSMG